MNYGYITTIVHWDQVRNAYYGPETWVETKGRPPLVAVDRQHRDRLPRGYLRVGPDDYWAADTYADWYLWPWLKARRIIGDRTWRILGYLHRCGLIHSVAQPGYGTRLRDIRGGRA